MATTKKTGKEMTPAPKQEIDTSAGEPTFEGRYFSFAADILEDEEAVTVLADMPGVAAEGLNIDLRDHVLTIMGRVEDVPASWRMLHGEYEIGGYLRRFTLGPDIDQDKIKANMKDGVLTLMLAKAERMKPRKIEISAG